MPLVGKTCHMWAGIGNYVQCFSKFFLITGLSYTIVDDAYATIGSNHNVSPVVVLTNIK